MHTQVVKFLSWPMHTQSLTCLIERCIHEIRLLYDQWKHCRCFAFDRCIYCRWLAYLTDAYTVTRLFFDWWPIHTRLQTCLYDQCIHGRRLAYLTDEYTVADLIIWPMHTVASYLLILTYAHTVHTQSLACLLGRCIHGHKFVVLAYACKIATPFLLLETWSLNCYWLMLTQLVACFHMGIRLCWQMPIRLLGC